MTTERLLQFWDELSVRCDFKCLPLSIKKDNRSLVWKRPLITFSSEILHVSSGNNLYRGEITKQPLQTLLWRSFFPLFFLPFCSQWFPRGSPTLFWYVWCFVLVVFKIDISLFVLMLPSLKYLLRVPNHWCSWNYFGRCPRNRLSFPKKENPLLWELFFSLNNFLFISSSHATCAQNNTRLKRKQNLQNIVLDKVDQISDWMSGDEW